MCLSNFLKIVTACPFGGNSLKIKVYFCFLLQANASLISHKELSTSLLWKSFHPLLCLANSLCLQPWWGKYSFLGTGKSMVCSFLQWWICWESYCFLIKLLLLASYTRVIWVRFFLSLCVHVCVCVQVMPSTCSRLALPVNIHRLAELDEIANWFGWTANQFRRYSKRSSSFHRTYMWPPQAQYDEQFGSQIKWKFPPFLSMSMTSMELAGYLMSECSLSSILRNHVGRSSLLSVLLWHIWVCSLVKGWEGPVDAWRQKHQLGCPGSRGLELLCTSGPGVMTILGTGRAEINVLHELRREDFLCFCQASTVISAYGYFKMKSGSDVIQTMQISSIQFSHSAMSNSLQPHGLQHARFLCPSPTSGACSNSCLSSRWCHPTILSSVIPFSSCLQSFPASGSFKWVSCSHQVAKVLEFQLQHQSFQWIFRTKFLAVQGTLKSLLQHHSSKASILRCSAFFIVQLSHPYMTTGKTIALTRQTFVGKGMSLLFSMLSRFVTAFLLSSKHFLISWLQSPSAVILEPKKIKYLTVSTVSPSICH